MRARRRDLVAGGIQRSKSSSAMRQGFNFENFRFSFFFEIFENPQKLRFSKFGFSKFSRGDDVRQGVYARWEAGFSPGEGTRFEKSTPTHKL